MRALRWWWASFGVTVVVAAACGARSELEDESPPPPTILDAGPDSKDAGPDIKDTGPDSKDTGPDVKDTGPDIEDAGPDIEDAGPDIEDAGPDIEDAGPDIEDAGPDVPQLTCEEAGITFIYLVSAQNTLFSYYPPSGVFTPLGTIKCPGTSATPYSMAVDRGGTAYVVFTDGHLFKVSTATAACQATSFVPGQSDFFTFGMGFSSNITDPGETLYVASSTGSTLEGLATIDTSSFKLSVVGPFPTPLGRTELTGTGDGRLFGFSLGSPLGDSLLSEIDKKTANLLSSKPLAVGGPSDAFAYAFWGDAFYIFTATGGGSPTQVTRYNPQDGSLAKVGTLAATIVGAGVSTCAPN